MAAAAPTEQRWLFGSVPDLLLRCGLLYVALIAVLGFAGREIRSLQPTSLDAFEAGLELDPDDVRLLDGAGYSWIELGEPERELGFVNLVLERHPKSPEALETAARAKQRIRDQGR